MTPNTPSDGPPPKPEADGHRAVRQSSSDGSQDGRAAANRSLGTSSGLVREDHVRGAAHTREPADLGKDRDRTAEDRDQRATAHDAESDARDDRADARDERAEAREGAVGVVDAAAAADRVGARRDRRGGASDRTQAADDRQAAASDRVLAARERAADCIDQLTGAHRRETGLLELKREMARAQRTQQPFTLAFVDIDHLKQTNDARGHAAGDQLLRQVADTIRKHLRSYDLIIRYGGDEFVCALPEVTKTQAAQRFTRVNDALADAGHASVSVGLTELETRDSLEDFINRADDTMYQARKQTRSSDLT